VCVGEADEGGLERCRSDLQVGAAKFAEEEARDEIGVGGLYRQPVTVDGAATDKIARWCESERFAIS
jgi:hypothetical protein